MRYSMATAGALLLAMSATLHADGMRDAGSKIRGDWWGVGQSNTTSSNTLTMNRSYSVAPSTAVQSAPAPTVVAQAAPAPAPVAQAQGNTAVRSFSYQPSTLGNGNRNAVAPYLRADHKVKAQYGD